jgi:hypothetical protein
MCGAEDWRTVDLSDTVMKGGAFTWKA